MTAALPPQVAADAASALHALGEHALLVAGGLGAGTVVAVPLGILLSRRPRLAEPCLALTGLLQTVPSLALFALLLPLLGVGRRPAVAALSIYALLPVLRNTYVGLRGVPAPVVDSARAMGMGPGQVLAWVELPLALPVVLAGIRLSAVYLISWAVLAALVGGGGLGTLIFEGLATYDFGLVLAGAAPAAALAVAAGLALHALQCRLTPQGLRRRRAGGEAA
jgi:osmoprotectant transport system permease protein